MATPPSDDSRTLFKLIADGSWHPYEEIRDRIAATVPPGRALRKYQERVAYARQYKNDPSYDTSASEDERIYLGAKACAQIAITSWKGRGVQYSGDGPNKQIRIKPGFKSWGLEAEGVGQPTPEASEGSEPAVEGGEQAQEQEVQEQEAQDWRSLLAAQEKELQDWRSLLAAGQPDDRSVFWGVVEGRRAHYNHMTRQHVRPVQRDEASVLPSRRVEPEVRELTAEEDQEAQRIFGPPEATDSEQAGEGLEPVKEPAPIPQERPLDRAEMALFNESEIRDLVAQEVAKQLDGFQGGMQEYLAEQFDQVRAQIAAAKAPSGRWIFEPAGDAPSET
jgi:hypothetical protein